MADAPFWTGMTAADQANWQNYDPRFIENMMAANAAGTLPTAAQQEAGRQESAQVFNTPYTPTAYAQPPQAQGSKTGWGVPTGGPGGSDMVNKGGGLQAPGSTGPGYFDPMGQGSVGGFSLADHQRIARMAGYQGEFGDGLFEAAQQADPGLRQRFTEGVNKFSQQATSANPNSWMQSLFPTGGPTFTMPTNASSGSWATTSDPLTQALQQLSQNFGSTTNSWGNPGAGYNVAPTLGAVMGYSNPSANPLSFG